jgi:hypothetical protein
MYLLKTMNYRKHLWRVAIFLFSAGWVFALPQNHTAATEAPPPLPPNAIDYVRQTLQHELDAQKNDHTHWRYRFHREDEKGSQDRDVIDAREGQIARTLLINGQPLNAEQRASDDARMRKLVEDSGERAKRAKREKDDEDKLMTMFKAIPDAFTFKYDGEENGQVRLTFFPSPHYDPPTRELQVFRSLSGKMWIDRAAGRLARMDGALFEDVTFGWGLLGRLNKGGTFSVVQSNVGQDHWEMIALDVTMSGHAIIFKSINVKQKQRVSDFQRVSDNLSIAEAYQLLVKPDNAVSAESQPGAVKPQVKN